MLRKTGIMFYGLLLLSVVRINGQNMFLMDSLKKQALSTSLSLSQQVNNLLVLSEEIQDLDSVQARKYAEEAMALAHGAGNDTLFADGLFREARLNISNLHFEVAKAQLDRELRLSQKAKYQSGTGRYDQGMGYLMIGHHEENDKDHKQIVDYFLSALKLFSKTNNHAEIAKCYLGLVKFYFDDQQGEKMDSTAQLAGKELTLCGDQRVMARYFQFIGKVYKFRSRAAKSYDFYRRALVCCIKIRDSVSIGYLKINLGNGLEQSGEDSLAIQSIREGITVLKSLERYKLKTVYANLALGHENLGEIYKKKKSKAECLDDFRKSIYYNTLAQKPYNEPLLLGNMGLAYVDFGMLDSALLVQNKALELRIKFHNKEGELFSYMSLGGIYLRKRDYRKAIDYEQKARVLSVLGFHAYDKDIYNILYNSYDSVKDYKNAFLFSEKYHAFADSVAKLNNASEIKKMEQKQEEEKREAARKAQEEARTAIQNAELKRQRLFRNAAIIILILVVIGAIFVLRSYFVKRKANAILTLQKEEIQTQKHIVDEKNKEILDSIQYAQRIQSAILPSDHDMNQALEHNFVLFQPKDIVSGDFYWLSKKEDCVLLAVADCTGHGVPGGFMSMLGTALLNEIVNEKKIHEPADILDMLRVKIILALKQKGRSGENQDGMDICMLKVDRNKMKLTYAAANNALYLIRGKELIEYKADKQPVGITGGPVKQFAQHTISLLHGDLIYAFTDGFADQFGGPKGKKYKYKQLEEQLLAMSAAAMPAQHTVLLQGFNHWKGNLEQVDDVTIIGIRV